MTLADQPAAAPLTVTSRLGGWLPWDPAQLNAWLAKTIADAEGTPSRSIRWSRSSGT